MKLTSDNVNCLSSLQQYINEVTVGEMFERFGDPNTDDIDYVAWNFEMPDGKVIPVYARQPSDDEYPWHYGDTLKIGGDSIEVADFLKNFIVHEFGVC